MTKYFLIALFAFVLFSGMTYYDHYQYANTAEVYLDGKKIYKNDSVISVRKTDTNVWVLTIFPGREETFVGNIEVKTKKSKVKYDPALIENVE